MKYLCVAGAAVALAVFGTAAHAATFAFQTNGVEFSDRESPNLYDVAASGTVTVPDGFTIDQGEYFFDFPIGGVAEGRYDVYGDDSAPFATYFGDADDQEAFGFGADLFLRTFPGDDAGDAFDVFVSLQFDFERSIVDTLSALGVGEAATVIPSFAEEYEAAFDAATGEFLGVFVIGEYDTGTVTFTRLGDADPDVAPVPLPAGAALLTAALGGLAAFRRRG